MISEVDEYYNTALREASENGFLKVIEYLIDLGANINCINNYVHVSCENGHLDVIAFFYKNGINFHYENDRPLRAAAEKGQLDVVKYLIDIGLDVKAESNYCIRKASENNHTSVVKYLIEKGANIVFVRNSEIRNILGLPKWHSRPKNMDFRMNNECSISGEILDENIEQLGCSSCRNVFKLDALEHWLNIHYRCPYCNSSDEFYLI